MVRRSVRIALYGALYVLALGGIVSLREPEWPDFFSFDNLLQAAIGVAGVVVTIQSSGFTRAQSLFWLGLFIALTSGQMVSTAYQAAESRQDNKRMITAMRKPSSLPKAAISVGTIRFDGQALNFSQNMVVAGFKVDVDPDGRLLINGDLRDASGAVVATLRDSILDSPAMDYDINWDIAALEVVDPDGLPVLQVVSAPAEIRVSFLNVDPVTHVTEVCHGRECTHSEDPNDAQIKRVRGYWKPIFQYPYHLHPGVRVANQGP